MGIEGLDSHDNKLEISTEIVVNVDWLGIKDAVDSIVRTKWCLEIVSNLTAFELELDKILKWDKKGVIPSMILWFFMKNNYIPFFSEFSKDELDKLTALTYILQRQHLLERCHSLEEIKQIMLSGTWNQYK